MCECVSDKKEKETLRQRIETRTSRHERRNEEERYIEKEVQGNDGVRYKEAERRIERERNRNRDIQKHVRQNQSYYATT